MMKDIHKPNKTHGSEHGSVWSYVVGFILSLIYTFIPYFLVVNEMLTGTTLLLVILGIAVLQMAIQLFFFLHLGRGPKPLYNVVFFFATAGVIVLTIGASLFIMDNLYRNMTPDEVILKVAQEENIAQVGDKSTGACDELGDNHVVTIEYGIAYPSFVEARLCDTLSFVNEEGEDIEILFGGPSEQLSYGGIYEFKVRSGRSEAMTLNQTGDFVYRSSQNPEATGGFSVVTE